MSKQGIGLAARTHHFALGIPLLGLVAGIALSCSSQAGAETYRLKDGQQWESVASDPEENYLHAISQLKELAQSGSKGELTRAIKEVKADYPDRTGPDLDLFLFGEWYYWRDHYGRALAKYEKMLKNYKASEFAAAALQREFEMAQGYLDGHKKTVLGFIKISGYEEGVSLMEKVTDRAGLDEPNGIGLRAAITVAEHDEAREMYNQAYLKWAEIASYWETGPVGKRALYRMAEDNLLAYDKPPEAKRANYDALRLSTAKTYYQKYQALYPADAKENEVPEKIRHIDEEMAYKQFTIAKFYRRTGKRQAANLYFNMIVRNWPDTEAGALAKEALEEDEGSGK